MTLRLNHRINNETVVQSDSKTLPIHNPATAEVKGEVAIADQALVDQAVAAAKAAFPSWAATPPLKRARILFQFKQLLMQALDELALLVTLEHGKTLEDAKASVMRGLEMVEYACGIPHLLKGDYSEHVAAAMDCYTIRQPLGVCVGVSPFNFPVMVPIWMFVSAIACGNTFILKPSEQDPSAPMHLAELMQQAGLPAGVLNVVNGDKDTVEALITHEDVAAVTAVASTPVAESIYQTAINHGKRAHTFGGAKNHCVVMPDANLEAAMDAITMAAYGAAGERCMALSVAIAVGDEVGDKLSAGIADRVRNLKIGPGIEEEIDMGPLVSQTHLDRVKSYVDLGVEEGATLVVDGRTGQSDQPGYFLGGSLFDHVTPQMRIYQEEIFGPVLCLIRVPDFESALALVNAHEYGNGTAIFTSQGKTAHDYAQRVQVGMVGVNVPIPVPVTYHSFGGWKRSFFGDVAMHGEQSLQFYTKVKSITTRWLD